MHTNNKKIIMINHLFFLSFLSTLIRLPITQDLSPFLWWILGSVVLALQPSASLDQRVVSRLVFACL